MSAQTNNDLVHVRQMAQSDFDALAVKDPCTVYFVNLTGVFTEQSLGEDGDIYLGSKLLTGQPDLTGVMKVDGTTLVLNDYSGTSFVEEFELAQALTDATILDFMLHLTLQHDNSTATDVECWVETGHYVEGKYEDDCMVASVQTTLAGSRNSVPVFGNIALSGTLSGPIESKVVRVCFNASASITVKRLTGTTGKDRASQLRIRVFTALNN